jgi:hypothetical protein
LARYIYEWKNTQLGRRLFRRPGTSAPSRAPAPTSAPEPTPEPTPEPEPESTTADYGALLKAELVEEAEERGLDSSGTRADIIERLEASDDD